MHTYNTINAKNYQYTEKMITYLSMKFINM